MSETVPYWRKRALEAEDRETQLMVKSARFQDALNEIAQGRTQTPAVRARMALQWPKEKWGDK